MLSGGYRNATVNDQDLASDVGGVGRERECHKARDVPGRADSAVGQAAVLEIVVAEQIGVGLARSSSSVPPPLAHSIPYAMLDSGIWM